MKPIRALLLILLIALSTSAPASGPANDPIALAQRLEVELTMLTDSAGREGADIDATALARIEAEVNAGTGEWMRRRGRAEDTSKLGQLLGLLANAHRYNELRQLRTPADLPYSELEPGLAVRASTNESLGASCASPMDLATGSALAPTLAAAGTKGDAFWVRVRSTLAAAIAMANAASAIPMRHFRRPLDLVAKEDESPETIADRDTERMLRDAIAAQFPGDGILGEEFGLTNPDAPARWIIDPIDGTRSFITGYPGFGMLLGRLQGGVPQLGVIRMPALEETFAGAPGLGASLTGAPIRVRQTRDLAQAFVYVNEDEKIQAADPARFAQLCRAGHTRRMAYDCYPHARTWLQAISTTTAKATSTSSARASSRSSISRPGGCCRG